ncbi:hypothetical protein GFS24_01960 [Chitinophaga sp. SYP-B3965]|uniref:hypothetical protein n=1 Tax=Chitinophaga sp. SYP-B3965 TaxID=2663120 RepID=UPI001299CF9C|nr:hypothetical protein [Chitinophaga sp. SYP-B3965]MRG43856.1 hypothetical protein [Chitinophaga sp. SYP-B3965]
MSLFGKLKSAFQASPEEDATVRLKMAALFMRSLEITDLNGYQLAYGKHMTTGPDFGNGRHTYYNYVVGFRPDPINIDLVLVPIDAGLYDYGAPIKINSKTFKKAGKTWLRRLYKFKTIYGNSFIFQVPPVNGKAANMFGSNEIAINQEAEAAAFSAFFQNLNK